MKLYRPNPIRGPVPPAVEGLPSARRAAEELAAGRPLIVDRHYGNGVAVLDELRVLLPESQGSYAQRRAARDRAREAALLLQAPIRDHRVDLDGAVPIGLLWELYPDLHELRLPFVRVQELHGAWKREQEGVHLPVLGHRLHPFFATYAPTRSEHLELFATWLSQYEGPRERAIDVGTGCGVLALMLCRAGFQQVLATDCNPNAVESVRRELRHLNPRPPITPLHADLLGTGTVPVELVVFNPPWVQGEVRSPLDQALVFEPGLFERFFEQACARLTPQGRVVLVFSNVLQLLRPDLPHPIEAELERGRLRTVRTLRRRAKASPGRKTKEKVEVWELARA